MFLLCIVHLTQEVVPLLPLEFGVIPIVQFGNHRNMITPRCFAVFITPLKLGINYRII